MATRPARRKAPAKKKIPKEPPKKTAGKSSAGRPAPAPAIAADLRKRFAAKPRPGARQPESWADRKSGLTNTATYAADGGLILLSVIGGGRPVRTIERSPDGGLIEKRYNPDGSVASATYTDPDGHTRIAYEHSKDAKGRDVYRWRHFDDYVNGGFTRSRSHTETVGKKRRLVSVDDEDWDWNGTSTYHADYDDNGEIEESTATETDANGKLRKKVTRQYDDGRKKGRQTIRYRPDGSTDEKKEKWDKDGRKSSETETHENADGSGRETETRYERDADGKIEKTVVTVSDYDESGTVTGQTTYTIP